MQLTINVKKRLSQSYSYDTVGYELVYLYRDGKKQLVYVNEYAIHGLWLNEIDLLKLAIRHQEFKAGDKLVVTAFKERGYGFSEENTPDCVWEVELIERTTTP